VCSTASSARSRRRAGRRGARRGARGQSTVELALALPFVVAALLLVVQVGLVVGAQVLVVHAAREAARAAAVGEPPPPPDGLDPARATVALDGAGGPPGSRVTATVTYTARTDIPLVGRFVPDVELRGAATMRVE
jgi:hypothetical protein